jgi:hypothetical protein
VNARDVLARLRLPDGRLWVDAAFPFQIEDARAVLADDGPPYNFLTRSRGSSKTGDLAAVALAMLLAAEDAARLVWCASDTGQGQLAIDAIDAYLRDGGLAGSAEVQSRRVTAPASGARLDVLPADEPGAWGLTPDAVFVDELANWSDTPAPRRMWEAISSAAAKRDDCRLVVLTTAGSPDHFAAKVLEHAKGSSLWRVHEVPGPAPWAEPERVAEQRARLPQAVYEQLFENRWVAAEGSFLDPAVVEAAFTLDGPTLDRAPNARYRAGLDLGAVSDASVLAIGHRQGEAVHLDRMQVWQGSRRNPVNFGEVETTAVEAHRHYGFSMLADPWQALSTIRRLRERGVRVEEFTFSQGSKQKLAASLLHALNSGGLKLYDAQGLKDELLGLRLKQSASGAWSFDHRSGGHDDRAAALALMLVGALEHGPEQRIVIAAGPVDPQAARRSPSPTSTPAGTPA